SLEGDRQAGEPLLVPVMQKGHRLHPPPTLAAIRAHAAREFERLPEPLRRLNTERRPMVTIGDALAKLTAEVDRLMP
ncbi:MAG TPA: nicotinate phosphoribosyltransferase, partial [Xanthobacteraceae bacterium]|nr:nicotinate phosphoribosyltransferase [Xanthobacteraceae bacterium]